MFQELNYSVFIEDGDGNILTQFGPIQHHGPGNLHHIIFYSLEKGQKYVVRMEAESAIENITSRYSFGKTSIVSHYSSSKIALIILIIIILYRSQNKARYFTCMSQL